jgi:hypothetical protein
MMPGHLLSTIPRQALLQELRQSAYLLGQSANNMFCALAFYLDQYGEARLPFNDG